MKSVQPFFRFKWCNWHGLRLPFYIQYRYSPSNVNINSSEIDRVFSRKFYSWLFEFFNVYSVMGAGDEFKETKYNWNRYSHYWVINSVTSTVCDFLLYIQHRYSLQVMRISARGKSIVFSGIFFVTFRIFKCLFCYGAWDETNKYIYIYIYIIKIGTSVLEF